MTTILSHQGPNDLRVECRFCQILFIGTVDDVLDEMRRHLNTPCPVGYVLLEGNFPNPTLWVHWYDSAKEDLVCDRHAFTDLLETPDLENVTCPDCIGLINI